MSIFKRSKASFFCLIIAVILIFTAFAWLSFSMVRAEQAREEDFLQGQILKQVRLAHRQLDDEFQKILQREDACSPTEFWEATSRETFGIRRFELKREDFLSESFSEKEQKLWKDLSRIQEFEQDESLSLEENKENFFFQRSDRGNAYRTRKRIASSLNEPTKVLPTSAPFHEHLNWEQERLASALFGEENEKTDSDEKTSQETNAVEYVGRFYACKLGNVLYCVRRILGATGELNRVQCIEFDTESLLTYLAGTVQDVFPTAYLELCDEKNETTLRSIPASLLFENPLLGETKVGGIRFEISLLMAWAGLILAVFGVLGFVIMSLRLSERRSVFASAVTHELRTPLTTFKIYSEMLSAGLVPEEKRQAYYEVLKQEAQRLSGLVENVLSLARIEKHGKLSLQRERITVDALCERLVVRAKKRLLDAGMDLKIEIEPTARGFFVKTEPSVLEQIIFNLADNAVKYAFVPEAKLKMSCGIVGKFLQINFEDCGKGIPKEFRGKLFEIFSRSAESAAGKQAGVGLGLALSRQLARELGGDLKLKKSDATGTCFSITIAR